MPRRLKAWAAVLLAIVICLVLVLPQVDLDNGVLKDVQTQTLVITLLSLAGAVILLLPLRSFCGSYEVVFEAGALVLLRPPAGSILRC